MSGPLIIPDGARPMSRGLLASFIEYALKGSVTAEEARRFMNSETEDAMILTARQELQDLLPHSLWANRFGKIPEKSLPEATVNRLYAIAKELREAKVAE
jgi:hypothetical protein